MVVTLIKTATSKRHKKGRKFGRHARRPGHARYLLEKRWLKNKARRVRKNSSSADYKAFCEKNGI